MELLSDSLYQRISGLRRDALDALAVLTHGDLAVTPQEAGDLIVAMQGVSNQLGSVQLLLMPTVAAV